jgi:hypothetical protein
MLPDDRPQSRMTLTALDGNKWVGSGRVHYRLAHWDADIERQNAAGYDKAANLLRDLAHSPVCDSATR